MLLYFQQKDFLQRLVDLTGSTLGYSAGRCHGDEPAGPPPRLHPCRHPAPSLAPQDGAASADLAFHRQTDCSPSGCRRQQIISATAKRLKLHSDAQAVCVCLCWSVRAVEDDSDDFPTQTAPHVASPALHVVLISLNFPSLSFPPELSSCFVASPPAAAVFVRRVVSQ